MREPARRPPAEPEPATQESNLRLEDNFFAARCSSNRSWGGPPLRSCAIIDPGRGELLLFFDRSIGACTRLLLSDAVNSPAAAKQVPQLEGHHLPLRIRAPQGIDGRGIFRDPVGRRN